MGPSATVQRGHQGIRHLLPHKCSYPEKNNDGAGNQRQERDTRQVALRRQAHELVFYRIELVLKLVKILTAVDLPYLAQHAHVMPEEGCSFV